MLRKVWRKHLLNIPTMVKLGKYYKTLLHITVEEEVDHEYLPEPPREIVAPFEEDLPIKVDQYQTSSTALTELYASEQTISEMLLFEVRVQHQEMIALWEFWYHLLQQTPVVPVTVEAEKDEKIEGAPNCLPQPNLEVTKDTDTDVSVVETEPEINIAEEDDGPIPEQETCKDSSSEDEEPASFEKPSPAPPRRSLKAPMDTSNWDEQAWIRAYRRMSLIMTFPRPPLESQEHFKTMYECDALRVLCNFPPLLGFFGVDYDDTWNKAARVIQRLFKKGYFLKLIAKVTRMNRELKKAEEITQNRKRRRLALKM